MPSIWFFDFVLLSVRPLFVVAMLSRYCVRHRCRWYPIRNCIPFLFLRHVRSWFFDVPTAELNAETEYRITIIGIVYSHFNVSIQCSLTLTFQHIILSFQIIDILLMVLIFASHECYVFGCFLQYLRSTRLSQPQWNDRIEGNINMQIQRGTKPVQMDLVHCIKNSQLFLLATTAPSHAVT